MVSYTRALLTLPLSFCISCGSDDTTKAEPLIIPGVYAVEQTVTHDDFRGLPIGSVSSSTWRIDYKDGLYTLSIEGDSLDYAGVDNGDAIEFFYESSYRLPCNTPWVALVAVLEPNSKTAFSGTIEVLQNFCFQTAWVYSADCVGLKYSE